MKPNEQFPYDQGLQQIRGIGPGLARRLAEAGIGDAPALAQADLEQVAAALQGLPVVSRERIQEWIDAAARLAPAPAAEAHDGQHYATFRLELLLDEGNGVRRTRAGHVQSGREVNWAGWQPARLTDFITGCAGLPVAAEAAPAPAPPPPAVAQRVGALRLHDLEVCDATTRQRQHILRRGQPYDVRFAVAVTGLSESRHGGDVAAPATRAAAAVYARPVNGAERRRLGQQAAMEWSGPEQAMRVGVVPGVEMAPGAYRLEVVFDLEEDTYRWPTASLSEGLVLVY